MSREETPVLSGSLPAFEMFMTSWEMLGKKYPRLEPFIAIGLKWAYKYYFRMDQTRAYVVAMGESCMIHPLYSILIVCSSQSGCTYVMDCETLGA